MDTNERKILEDAGVLYPTIVSNADRIRAMTDEDLANFLWKCGQPCCPPINCAYKKCDAENCWLDWLKQEAKDD